MSVFNDYRVTSDFGWRTHPMKRSQKWHTGIDLMKSHRAPIFAFTEGEALFAGMGQQGTGLGGFGNVVLIKDKNNRGQLYAHLDSVTVKKGQKIGKGQEVGKQGTTGITTRSHLHYEVRKKAQIAPPFGWDADRQNNCLNPTEYLESFYDTKVVSNLLARQYTNKGEEVRRLQNKLLAVDERLPQFGADGAFGKETEDAVKAFQARRGLKVDGIVGPQILTELEKFLPKYSRLLGNQNPFISGTDVQAIQRVLGVKADSIYGPVTEIAVKNYQSKHKLTVDGIVGPETWSHMF